MFEQILQDGETVELQEKCDYCGDGALAIVNTGWAILTNKRFIICKDKGAIKDGLKAGAGYVLFGGILGTLLKGLLTKGSAEKSAKKELDKANKVEKEDLSFMRDDIANAEPGSRGVRKMLVIKTKSGGLCKISVKDKAQWQSALTS